MANAPMNKAGKAKGSGRSGVKRSKGSSYVPNGMANPLAGMAGPMGVPPSGGPQGPAAPMMAPQMPPNGSQGQ